MESLTSSIKSFVYHNPENGYSVVRLDGGATAVGTLPSGCEGETIEFIGEWKVHPKFGRQFAIEQFNMVYPVNETGIISYLSSGIIKGVGKRTAEKIVKHFGKDTIDVLDNNINRLDEVPGLPKKVLVTIKEVWPQQRAVKDIMIFLQSHGVSPAFSLRIHQYYGDAAVQIVKANPYQLAFDIYGMGFKSVDKIGRNLGIEKDDLKRIKAGLIYVLEEEKNSGHTYLPLAELDQKALKILELEELDLYAVLEELVQFGHLIVFEEKVYVPYLFWAERTVEKQIKRLLAAQSSKRFYQSVLRQVDEDFFTEEQISAVRYAFEENILIITGGPGTGKTTTLRGIIDLFMAEELVVTLAAPTGRAAKRMSEVIGYEASTIHRLLEFNPAEGRFGKNEDNPIDTDLLVIDETSMVDIQLMAWLLTAVKEGTTLVLVGDINQLPSVGPGNVLKDLIDSDLIPYIALTKIFRQAEESKIIVTAHEINRGVIPTFDRGEGADLFLLEDGDADLMYSRIVDLCLNRLPSKFGFNPVVDIQVLAPMYKGDFGVDKLNSVLQSALNPEPIRFEKGHKRFKVGDKVMQLKNNYEYDIFNGDIGFISSIIEDEGSLTVEFDGKSVEYTNLNIDEITLAYACTIHKSQGSEYPCVIIVMQSAHYVMLQRNLLYTAITRAKKLLFLFSTRSTVATAVRNNRTSDRYTTLFKINGGIQLLPDEG